MLVPSIIISILLDGFTWNYHTLFKSIATKLHIDLSQIIHLWVSKTCRRRRKNWLLFIWKGEGGFIYALSHHANYFWTRIWRSTINERERLTVKRKGKLKVEKRGDTSARARTTESFLFLKPIKKFKGWRAYAEIYMRYGIKFSARYLTLLRAVLFFFFFCTKMTIGTAAEPSYVELGRRNW